MLSPDTDDHRKLMLAPGWCAGAGGGPEWRQGGEQNRREGGVRTERRILYNFVHQSVFRSVFSAKLRPEAKTSLTFLRKTSPVPVRKKENARRNKQALDAALARRADKPAVARHHLQ